MTATFHPYQRRTVHAERLDLVPNYAARRLIAAVVALAVLALGAIAVVETVGALVDLGGRPAAASEIPASGSGRGRTEPARRRTGRHPVVDRRAVPRRGEP